MGNTEATNKVSSAISSMTQVIQSSTQECTSSADTQQAINVITENCDVSNVNIHDIKFRSFVSVNIQCAQQAAMSADVTTKIDQTAKQMAEAVSQSLNLNPGSTKANNIMELSMSVGTAIKNSTSQIVSEAVTTAQSITVKSMNGKQCNVNISYITFDALSKGFVKATQESTQVAKAVTDLKQTITQEAIAKQSSLIILVIIAIIIAIGFTGGQAVRPLIYVGVPVLGATYAWRYYVDKKAKERENKSKPPTI